MKVKDLIEQLKQMNPSAEVMVMTETDDERGYQTVFDCEEEYSNLVTLGCGYPVHTKEQLKSAMQRCDHEYLELFYSRDIGQGMGYKLDKEWDKMLDNEIIYIPEVGYREKLTDRLHKFPTDIDCVYTKQDFIDIVKDKVKPSRINEEAQALFYAVDWQTPEALAEEWEFDSEYEEPSDKAFDPKINCRGCKSKCVDKKTGKPACEEVDDLCENITWCPKSCGKY